MNVSVSMSNDATDECEGSGIIQLMMTLNTVKPYIIIPGQVSMLRDNGHLRPFQKNR